MCIALYEEMGRNNSISKLGQESNDVLGKRAEWYSSLLALLAFAQWKAFSLAHHLLLNTTNGVVL